MKIHIILPVNNKAMLKEEDLQVYRDKSEHEIVLQYADTALVELNTASDVEAVIPKVHEAIEEARANDADVIILYAFGDVGITLEDENAKPPIVSAGRIAVRAAAAKASAKFTVIPAHIEHAPFIEALITEEGLRGMFQSAQNSPNLNPKDVREDAENTLKLLKDVIIKEIENGTDTFTFGCGSFIGFSKPLEVHFRAMYGDRINMVELLDQAIDYASNLTFSPSYKC